VGLIEINTNSLRFGNAKYWEIYRLLNGKIDAAVFNDFLQKPIKKPAHPNGYVNFARHNHRIRKEAF
jgi:hypothetical protein